MLRAPFLTVLFVKGDLYDPGRCNALRRPFSANEKNKPPARVVLLEHVCSRVQRSRAAALVNKDYASGRELDRGIITDHHAPSLPSPSFQLTRLLIGVLDSAMPRTNFRNAAPMTVLSVLAHARAHTRRTPVTYITDNRVQCKAPGNGFPFRLPA